jgi:mannose-P-dolichol utilization defect protein 1
MEAVIGPLRSALQPITHNLPAPVADTGRTILGPACYKHLLIDIDPVNYPDCVKLAISKGLSYGIIGASGIVKVPQLIKLLNSQSSAGISFLSYLLESGAYLISLSYNIRHKFPFSTYGETALILAQNVVIASLVLKYSGKTAGIAAWIAGLGAAAGALFREDIVDVSMLNWLQGGAGVLGVASKLPQIITIWQEGGTGQLSAFAVSFSLLPSPLFYSQALGQS